MQTNLLGRIRNTSLSVTGGRLALFEAVVNSIHAIEEAGMPADRGLVEIAILRDMQPKLDLGTAKRRGREFIDEIVGFKITDNGVGFTDQNMDSFHTLDSDHKAERGGRGVGRLLWLKVFQRVNVTSVFDAEDGARRRRTFAFSSAGVRSEELTIVDKAASKETIVHLDTLDARYRPHFPKSARAIADDIVEHCLWYFIRKGGAPHIFITDGVDRISLDDAFDAHMHSKADHEKVSIKGRDFELVHVRLRSNKLGTHAVALCAGSRVVTEDRIPAGKIPGLFGKVIDGDGEFIYSCYVSSDFLDECARAERTGFEILESSDGLFQETEIGLADIREKVLERAQEYLAPYTSANIEKAKQRVDSFVSHKAPRYRPVMARIAPEALVVDPDISDRDLDVVLHKLLADFEGALRSEGHDIMAPQDGEQADAYRERLAEYLRKVEDIKKSDLVNYVAHRKVILDLLERALVKGSDGKYSREDLIHELIMPMRKDSTEVFSDSCNLWIVDERLAFHDYLASDKSLASMPITGSDETKEPDLLALNVFGNPLLVSEGDRVPLASIVVVEIKRPMRNDATSGEEDDPVEQALGYLDRVRNGKVKTSNGRPIPSSENIPGFCYVLCDLTPTVEKRCKVHDMIRTSDGLGYFVYKAAYKAYVEVISFDRLVNAAKERNRAFFDRLGLP